MKSRFHQKKRKVKIKSRRKVDSKSYSTYIKKLFVKGLAISKATSRLGTRTRKAIAKGSI